MTLTFMTTKASSSDAGRVPRMRYFSAAPIFVPSSAGRVQFATNKHRDLDSAPRPAFGGSPTGPAIDRTVYADVIMGTSHKNDAAGHSYRVTRNQESASFEQQWRAFDQLPGTRLGWRRSGHRAWRLLSLGGSEWAAIHMRNAGIRLERCTIVVDDQSFEMTRGKWNVWMGDSSARDLIDTSGDVQLSRTGKHFGREATTRIDLRNRGSFAFPVRTYSGRGVMKCFDESGTPIIHYRWKAPPLSRFTINAGVGRMNVEMVVGPSAQLIQGIALVAAVSSELLPAYFRFRSAGGA